MTFRSQTGAPTRGRAREGQCVLVVDDDPKIRALVSWRLEADGFATAEAADGEAALRAIETRRPALVILDLGLPGLAGLDVLARIGEGYRIPVIILTGRAGETDRIVGLDLGADDYVVKPFSPAEVSARVRAVLRRGTPPSAESRLDHGDLVLDGSTREVIALGRPVRLSATEFELLWFLAASPRRVFTRPQLLERVWGGRSDPWQGESTVTQHVHRLRHKLEPDPRHPRWLRTVVGVGYRFEP